MQKKREQYQIDTLHTLPIVLLDILLVISANFLALLIRFDFEIQTMLRAGPSGRPFIQTVLAFIPLSIICTIAAFSVFKLYSTLWEFAGYRELFRVAFAAAAVSIVQFAIMSIFRYPIPRSFPFFTTLLIAVFCGGGRILLRVLSTNIQKSRRERIPTMIIGAGKTGAMVLREFESNQHSKNKPVCIIDDDQHKIGSYLNGIKVVGDRYTIPKFAEKYKIEDIVFAIPEIDTKAKKEILDLCQTTSCHLKIMPSLYQLANGEVSVQKIRDVMVEDLLGREAVKVNTAEISNYVCGKRILVTGGGGSIGSELCRQIAHNAPECLIIFDIYENNAYDIQQELQREYPGINLVTLIGSVRDEKRVDDIFKTYRPEIVYHAAAHKHVPLMETSPFEAIKNNVFGTLNVARAADRHKAEAMVLISTDKAVNPTNVMGATKRICEMIVQTLDRQSDTRYVAVRFGNVLGSNGSVIPLFRKQIAEGGPVTVTHKDIIRFFMTIPEAVSLVLQAGAYAKGGEIFVLDMGQPVKIDDLARNMIRLSGFKPDEDIPIVYTGLRPGEKLYEEILMAEEGLDKTPNNLIYIGHPNDFDYDEFLNKLEELRAPAMANSPDIRKNIAEIVSTYHERRN